MGNELETTKKLLKEKFNYGHPDFVDITFDEMDLHSKKNKDYAKGGNSLGNFNRVSNILSNYPNLDLSQPKVVALVYAMKQLDAVLWMWSQKYEGEVEGVQDRLRDIHIYMKLIRILAKEENEQTKERESQK